MSAVDPPHATRSRENTRARLMAAASEVFAESGFDGASVEEICERAGFTRGAFYSNFASKDDLFFALANQFAEHNLEQVVSRMRELELEPRRYRGPAEIVEHVLESTNDAPGVVLVSEIRTNAMRDERLAAAYVAWQEAMVDRVAEILRTVCTIYGLRLRVPVSEAAWLFVQIGEACSMHVVIARLDAEAARRLITSRTSMLAELIADAA